MSLGPSLCRRRQLPWWAMLGINPFDQPDGASKRLAMSRLDDASNAGGVVKPVGAKVEGRGFAVFFPKRHLSL